LGAAPSAGPSIIIAAEGADFLDRLLERLDEARTITGCVICSSRPPCAKRPIEAKRYPTTGLPFLVTSAMTVTMLLVRLPHGLSHQLSQIEAADFRTFDLAELVGNDCERMVSVGRFAPRAVHPYAPWFAGEQAGYRTGRSWRTARRKVEVS
jgi:hypothetical protein